MNHPPAPLPCSVTSLHSRNLRKTWSPTTAVTPPPPTQLCKQETREESRSCSEMWSYRPKGSVLWIFPPFPMENASPNQSQVKAALTESTVETKMPARRRCWSLLNPAGGNGLGQALVCSDISSTTLHPHPPTRAQTSLEHTLSAPLSEKLPTGAYITHFPVTKQPLALGGE